MFADEIFVLFHDAYFFISLISSKVYKTTTIIGGHFEFLAMKKAFPLKALLIQSQAAIGSDALIR